MAIAIYLNAPQPSSRSEHPRTMPTDTYRRKVPPARLKSTSTPHKSPPVHQQTKPVSVTATEKQKPAGHPTPWTNCTVVDAAVTCAAIITSVHSCTSSPHEVRPARDRFGTTLSWARTRSQSSSSKSLFWDPGIRQTSHQPSQCH